MTDRDALLAAALADPDDDLPRLALADAVEEAGDPDYAGFVRGQCALAAAPDWEPVAVAIKHRRPDWVSGQPWRHLLPPLPPIAAEWHPDRPFRRGLGWCVVVRDLTAFLQIADALFDAAQVGELHLPTAARSEWQRFAARPWLPRVRAVRFYGLGLPIEPVRVLAEADRATGLEAVTFDHTASPAAGELIGDFLRSLVGKRLKRLDLRSGYARWTADLADALADLPDPPRLDRLGLGMAGLTPPAAERLADSPFLDSVTDLDLTLSTELTAAGFKSLFPRDGRPRLRRLTLAGAGLAGRASRTIAAGEPFAGLKALDLSDNPRVRPGLGSLFRRLTELRSLKLWRCGIGDGGLAELVRSPVWPGLVELDLRQNGLTDAGGRSLVAAGGPQLASLRLGGNPIGDGVKANLRATFGDAVDFTASP
ncbi:MAG: TIGR02996 domain-containing protein [Gemmataceae bacterium]